MYGGAGSDTYEVDNAGDTAHEDAIGGVDLVESTVTYTLAANVEKLTSFWARRPSTARATTLPTR